jgi:SAM-dependent methyltransferase
MDEKLAVNRDVWDAWTKIHERSHYYRLDAFKAGDSALTPVMRDELGDVAGASILHIQCHFGMETLSLARMGAQVTGVDFSPEAVRLAGALADELGLPARFVCSDVFAAPAHIDDRFDIVLASYGSIPWISDLQRWFAIAAGFVKPGGVFYMAELHPFLSLLDDTGTAMVHPYFFSEEPRVLQWQGSYADPEADFEGVSYFWSHSVSEVISGVLGAGLHLSSFHEFPYVFHRCFPFVHEYEPGKFAIEGGARSLPHMFTLKARKPG